MTQKASDKNKQNDPCWKGYEQAGMKEKDGKQVPNCIPENKKKAPSNKK